MPPLDLPEVAIAALLEWYDRHRRRMPWRALPGQAADPYRVWLSEIMLQQTTVAAVIPYFARFTERFPTVQHLATAPDEAVMQAWAGLGYYARARNLHACARQVAETGGFPRTAAALRTLPGIGPYTATAIAAIAFGQPGIPIDGNVDRVLSRIGAITTPLPQGKPAIAALAGTLAAQPAAIARPSDTAQALFDLGATLCTPAKPACALCPWRIGCAGHAQGIQASLPRKMAKASRPIRHGTCFYAADAAGLVLLRRRPPTGLLGGMAELPGSDWTGQPLSAAAALAIAPVPADWRPAGQVRHVFTHFELRLDVQAARIAGRPELVDPAGQALPSLMRKALALGQAALAETTPAKPGV